MTNKKLVIDLQTGETYEEDLSKETIAFHKKINEQLKAAEAEATAKAAQRRAILEHLKITEEEARILLGGN